MGGFGGRESWLVLTLVGVMLTGCTAPAGVLRFETATEDHYWPPLPETPRVRYVGQLTGEDNFRMEAPRRSFGQKVLNWITGLWDTPHRLQLQRPQAVTVDAAGRIYVSDVSRQAIFVFDPAAGRIQLWEWAAVRQRFVAPIGVVAGDNDTIYVADAELGLVVQLAADGKPGASFGQGILQRPTGLARDPASGTLYVADTHAHDIKVFDAGGRLLRTLGRRGEAVGEFNYPTHLSFAHGRLYVADSMNARIQVLQPDGTAEQAFGRRGLYVGNMPRPKGVTADDEGNIYVVESYYDHLLVYSDQGQLLLPIGGTGSGIGQFYLPAGLWMDRSNRLFVADMFNGRVVVFQYLGEV